MAKRKGPGLGAYKITFRGRHRGGGKRGGSTPPKLGIFTGRHKGGFIKGGFGKCALVPVFVPGEHANVPSFRFSFWGNIRMYPRSGFRSGGTSAKTTLLETTLLGTPDIGPPFVWYVFHLPRVSVLCFLCQNPRLRRPEALLAGSRNCWEGACFGTVSSLHTFCTPPCHGPIHAHVLLFGSKRLTCTGHLLYKALWQEFLV